MGVIGLSLLVASVVYFCIFPRACLDLVRPLLQSLSWRSARRSLSDKKADDGVGHAAPAETAAAAASPTLATAPETAPGTDTGKSTAVRDARPAPPPPAIHTAPVLIQTDGDEEDEPTTPKAAPAPVLSLSTPDGDEDADSDEDDMSPPIFPAAFSAQRAGGGTGADRPPGLMAPPPRPLSALRTPSTSSAAAPPNSTPSSLSSARRLPTLQPVPARGGLAVPARGPAPARGLPGASSPSLAPPSSLAPPPSSTTRPAKPARKVMLTPGHSPLDWARLTADPRANLRNLPPDAPYLLRVTPSQLKSMNGRRGRDAWTALGGVVYNMTPYAPFHPGGEPELLRCAGRIGDKLFNDVHSWVNYDNMLSACRIGILVDEHASTASPMEEMD